MSIPQAAKPAYDWMGPDELDALVRGYTDEQLAEHHQSAAKEPGTEWHRLLSNEIERRNAGRQ